MPLYLILIVDREIVAILMAIGIIVILFGKSNSKFGFHTVKENELVYIVEGMLVLENLLKWENPLFISPVWTFKILQITNKAEPIKSFLTKLPK